MNKKREKQILKNQEIINSNLIIIDSKINALLNENGMDVSQFKTVNPTIKPPKPPGG